MSTPPFRRIFASAAFPSTAGTVWIVAVLFYGVGDTLTTLVGLQIGGVAEIGPIAGPAMAAYGAAGLVGIKVCIFGAIGILWHLLETPGRLALPLGLAVVGVAVTTWNVAVIVSSL